MSLLSVRTVVVSAAFAAMPRVRIGNPTPLRMEGIAGLGPGGQRTCRSLGPSPKFYQCDVFQEILY